jgi:hypothetical protein
MNSSWKTTLCGLLALVGGGIFTAYQLKPELLADFPKWMPGLGFLMMTIGGGFTGVFARDNNKTSEQVGATPQPGQSQPVGIKVMLLAGALLLPLPFCLTSCTATPARIAYNAVALPAVTVDQAMGAWGDYVAQFHPPAATEQKVKAAFEHYQSAELLAIDAAQAYAALSAGSSTNSVAIAARLNSLATSQAAGTALADLVNLLRNLGVRI